LAVVGIVPIPNWHAKARIGIASTSHTENRQTEIDVWELLFETVLADWWMEVEPMLTKAKRSAPLYLFLKHKERLPSVGGGVQTLGNY